MLLNLNLKVCGPSKQTTFKAVHELAHIFARTRHYVTLCYSIQNVNKKDEFVGIIPLQVSGGWALKGTV